MFRKKKNLTKQANRNKTKVAFELFKTRIGM